MRLPFPRRRVLAAAFGLALCAPAAWGNVDPDDMKLIEAADCAELAKEYRNYSKGEKEIEAQIKSDSRSTVTTNVIGITAMATLGIGFFTWNDNADAAANLAELKAYREAIGSVAKKKNCAL